MKKIISLQEALQDYKEAKKQPWHKGTPVFNRSTGECSFNGSVSDNKFSHFSRESTDKHFYTLEWICRTYTGKDTFADAITAEQAEEAIKAVFPEYNDCGVTKCSYPPNPTEILKFLSDNGWKVIDDHPKEKSPHLVTMRNGDSYTYLTPEHDYNIFFAGGVLFTSRQILKEFFGFFSDSAFRYAYLPYGERTDKALTEAENAFGFLEETDKYPIFTVTNRLHPETCSASLGGIPVKFSYGYTEDGKWCFTFNSTVGKQFQKVLSHPGHKMPSFICHTYVFSEPVDFWDFSKIVTIHEFKNRIFLGMEREYYDFGTKENKQRIHWLDFPSDDILTKISASLYYC